MLSFRPVPKSKLLHSPQVHHGFVPKLSPHSGKKHKKLSAHGWVAPCSPLLEGTTLGVCYPLFGQTVLLPSFRRGWGRWSAPTFGCRPRRMLFYVFARRRGDFAEMMGVRGEGRGACSPELTSSQTSRHAVLTASAGVFSVFFKTFASFVYLDVYGICQISDQNNYCHKKRPRVRSLLSG